LAGLVGFEDRHLGETRPARVGVARLVRGVLIEVDEDEALDFRRLSRSA